LPQGDSDKEMEKIRSELAAAKETINELVALVRAGQQPQLGPTFPLPVGPLVSSQDEIQRAREAAIVVGGSEIKRVKLPDPEDGFKADPMQLREYLSPFQWRLEAHWRCVKDRVRDPSFGSQAGGLGWAGCP